MISSVSSSVKLYFNEENLNVTFDADGAQWQIAHDFRPHIITADGILYFSDAQKISHSKYISGVGDGIISHYEFDKLSFDTIIWVETACSRVHFEFIPIDDEHLYIKEVCWPGHMEFSSKKPDHYTLINFEQGLLIPNDWPTELGKLPFGGRMGTSDAYMPWFGQVRENCGYIAICEQPADAGYYAIHPEGGGYTHVGLRFFPSLGKMSFRRTACYMFLNNCDYNSLCKTYRNYIKEQGRLRTLREKECAAPVSKLFGTAFVHAGIKTHVQPDSRFYDKEHPEKNDHLVTFAHRAAQIRHYHDDLKLKKLYLHLDGWGEPGYDNNHPDYTPACEAAGGWEGMRSLVDTCHECGYSFGIHDQYRDYYFTAKTFDKKFATKLADGNYPEHASWAGGHQTYLCATQAPYYVRRNFTELEQNKVKPDCAYLDVFTCNEGDECSDPHHTMTRSECFAYRGSCFSYLLANGILTSSEEVTDWAVPNLVFCHYAPYDFMMRQPGSKKYGIPVPLYNLVYHDCVIIPWMMENYEHEDYMLYALINGGAPYLHRFGSYEDTDGAFTGQGLPLTEEEMAARCKIVMKLHEHVAACELVTHKLLSSDGKIQQSIFSDGTTVTINQETKTFEITYAPER